MEMDWIARKVKGLTSVCEFSEFDLRVRRLVQEENSAELVGSCLVAKSVLEASLNAERSSDSGFTLLELFGQDSSKLPLKRMFRVRRPTSARVQIVPAHPQPKLDPDGPSEQTAK